MKFKYIISVLFLTVIMFVGGITYKDLFQGMIEKIPDFTEDSAVRKISSSEISSIVF